ncbi:MAG: hypothetical protein APF81_16635 [Desulfosporosinus sp. BRH_c37]|nr:MAG: hypothetical protein APF81_16635 [Desulfosporosinus sp. BRH_c37]
MDGKDRNSMGLNKAKVLEMVKTSLKINADENFDAFDALGNIYGQDWGSLISEGDKLLAADPKDKTGAIFKFYGLFSLLWRMLWIRKWNNMAENRKLPLSVPYLLREGCGNLPCLFLYLLDRFPLTLQGRNEIISYLGNNF